MEKTADPVGKVSLMQKLDGNNEGWVGAIVHRQAINGKYKILQIMKGQRKENIILSNE